MPDETKEIAKHTPGPWELSNNDPFGIYSQDWDRLAGTNFATIKRETAKANARLIAAAPELLEALKKLLNSDIYADGEGGVYVEYADEVPQAKAAIAKAEGR